MHDPESVGEDRQNGVDPAVGHVERAVHHPQVGMAPDASVLVRHGRRRVGAHPARSRLVLAAAEHHVFGTGAVGGHPGSTGCTPKSLGCNWPLSRATGIPKLSVTEWSSWTRECAEVTSCTGPTTRCILGSKWRMPCLAARPCGPIRPACRR